MGVIEMGQVNSNVKLKAIVKVLLIKDKVISNEIEAIPFK